LRNLFVLETLLVSIRARDLSSGNIATVRPANPAASIASLRVKSPGVDVDAVCAHSAAESNVEAASAASKTNRGRISVGLCRVCADGTNQGPKFVSRDADSRDGGNTAASGEITGRALVSHQ